MGVSIIVPYHRGEHFFRDCLDSIVESKLEDYEVIIVYDKNAVYDASVIDNQRENKRYGQIIEEYKSLLPIYNYVLIDKTGVAAARNLGISKASKEYVYFLDSDDYVIHDGLHKMLQIADENVATIVSGVMLPTWFKRYTFLKSVEQTTSEDSKENIVESAKRYDVCDIASQLFQEEVSVLNLLIKRSWLQERELQFDEANQFYSDFPFVSSLLAGCTDHDIWICSQLKTYAKRSHNDTIQYPSLTQIKAGNRMEQFLEAFVASSGYIGANQEELRYLLDVYCCKFLLHNYEKSYHGRKSYVMSEETFGAYSMALHNMSQRVFIGFSKEQQQILSAIRSNQRKKVVKIANKMIMKQKKIGLFGNTIQRARVLDKLIFRRLPVKQNWVMFESFGGKSYSDNCKYIYEYMLKNYGDEYKYIWVMRDHSIIIQGNPTVIKPNTYQYLYYLSRAKFLVFNSRQPIWYNKRKESVFIETWHGTPLKKLVFDMEDVHSATLTHKEDFYKVSRKWDYLISDNAFSTEVFKHAFLFDKDKIAEYGYPRNDLLYADNTQEITKRVKEKLGIPLEKKVILYAPTWRDDEFYSHGKYKFSLAIDIEQMKQALGEEYVLLLRTHYFVVDQVDSLCGDGFVYNGSRYQDITELYLASDICVTDYSSVFFDYANLRRPILFFVYDLEKYKEELHGFYIDMETEVPGPLLQTNEQLLQAIEHINDIEETYKERYNTFYNRFCAIDDGHAAERIVEKLIRNK
ncbi:CDP-glycerol:glycerophosphate glycerophosphotransferase [Anaerosporobacter sp.]|uniref:CDP-glycerol:glycerophosphate glycerophosphotransferase n=1 Tax=Anaerosporobacter sp. TaxID=1872529 RepID=UPI00286EC0AA|nr:bifunctional glycosyltransferase family 2 protein/CDP-glycerol:glycerophosphate glycerophosphotransferase [Anaerosporobacter sp.]